MAITPISTQNTSAATLQNQEQQLLSQIKSLQNKDPQGNAAQIQVLQHKYKALLQQQQQQNGKTKDTDTKVSEVPSSSMARTVATKGVDIKA